jgi:hypothetical protein
VASQLVASREVLSSTVWVSELAATIQTGRVPPPPQNPHIVPPSLIHQRTYIHTYTELRGAYCKLHSRYKLHTLYWRQQEARYCNIGQIVILPAKSE